MQSLRPKTQNRRLKHRAKDQNAKLKTETQNWRLKALYLIAQGNTLGNHPPLSPLTPWQGKSPHHVTILKQNLHTHHLLHQKSRRPITWKKSEWNTLLYRGNHQSKPMQKHHHRWHYQSHTYSLWIDKHSFYCHSITRNQKKFLQMDKRQISPILQLCMAKRLCRIFSQPIKSWYRHQLHPEPKRASYKEKL